MRGNLSRLDDAALWRQVVGGEVAPIVEDADFLSLAAANAPEAPWDQSTWGPWTTRRGSENSLAAGGGPCSTPCASP